MCIVYLKNLAVNRDMQLMRPVRVFLTISYRLLECFPLIIIVNRRNTINKIFLTVSQASRSE